MKTLLLIVCAFGLMACQEPLKPHMSGNFLHRSTETISDHETIDIYYDSMNEKTCYLYRNTYAWAATNFSCVPK
jgi:hypothetical protein